MDNDNLGTGSFASKSRTVCQTRREQMAEQALG